MNLHKRVNVIKSNSIFILFPSLQLTAMRENYNILLQNKGMTTCFQCEIQRHQQEQGLISTQGLRANAPHRLQ